MSTAAVCKVDMAAALTAVADGEKLETAARRAGICGRTLRRRVARDPQLLARYRHAQAIARDERRKVREDKRLWRLRERRRLARATKRAAELAARPPIEPCPYTQDEIDAMPPEQQARVLNAEEAKYRRPR